MSWPVVAVSADDSGYDEVRAGHTDSTDDKDGLAAKAVDVQDSWDRGQEHDDADNAGGEQGGGTAAETKAVEDEWCVVEDGVDLEIQSA